MKDIKSFQIDHTRLKKGLYVSRIDRVGILSHVTTFDLRFRTPYEDEPLKPAVAHTLEHCLAYYLRNVRNDIVYVGPMGCMTGFYVIIRGKACEGAIYSDLIEALEWVLRTNQIPGATVEQCGNFTFMDLDGARKAAFDYINVLR